MFAKFIGQQEIKEDLVINIVSALTTVQPLDHTVFYGPPGLGKTTISEMIADIMLVKIWQQTGQELKKEKLYEIYERIAFRDILFIDEMHAVDTKTCEILYGPMQIINNLKLSKITEAKFIWEGKYINPFTVIGATTSAGDIAKPMRDRMVLSYQLRPYSIANLKEILTDKGCPKESANIISERARGVPRTALNYFLRIRNQAIYEEKITIDHCFELFNRIGVNNEGFLQTDLDILRYLLENGNASEAELFRSIGIDRADYSNMYEPFLLQNKMIRITSKGRSLTKKGIEYIQRCS